MNAFNPIASMQRLEAAGVKRALDALENKLTLRICGILGGLLTLGFAAIGLTIAFS